LLVQAIALKLALPRTAVNVQKMAANALKMVENIEGLKPVWQV